jgi:hypothetical protein
MFKAPSLHIGPRRRRARDDPRRAVYILAVVVACGITLILQVFWTAENRHKFAPFAIERVRCDVCRGLGVLSKPDEKGGRQLHMCPACFGLGARSIRRMDEHDALCPACVGFGRVEDEDGSWRWCRRCDGRGFVRQEDAPPPMYKAPVPRYKPAPEPPAADAPDAARL